MRHRHPLSRLRLRLPPQKGNPRRAYRTAGGTPLPPLDVRSVELQVDTGGRRVLDVSDHVHAFAADAGSDGLLHVFVPHATAGVALMETGAGSEADLDDALERLLPRDDRYAHRHGSVGHGGDHLLPVLVSPSLTLPVIDGRVALGTWQSVVVVDPNRENNTRTVRLSFVPA
jgi:secondary thiamine-phosphate synthase enzyme